MNLTKEPFPFHATPEDPFRCGVCGSTKATGDGVEIEARPDWPSSHMIVSLLLCETCVREMTVSFEDLSRRQEVLRCG